MAEQAICKGHSCSFRHNEGQLNHQRACIFSLKLHCQLQPVSTLLVSSRKTSIYMLISRCALPEESLQDGNKPSQSQTWNIIFLNCQIHLPFATHIHPLKGKEDNISSWYTALTYQMWASSPSGPPSIMGRPQIISPKSSTDFLYKKRSKLSFSHVKIKIMEIVSVILKHNTGTQNAHWSQCCFVC